MFFGVLVMTANNKKSVLFLCTGNSARSQMAEAVLKHKAADKFDVFSAGTHPEQVDERAIHALNQFGIDTVNPKSKSLTEYEGKQFDYVITLCDKATSECRSFPNTTNQYAWDFPDPKDRSGFDPFNATLNEINNRISMFLLVESKVESKAQGKTTPDNPAQISNLDPVSFYKCLTDDIRLKTLLLMHYHGEICVCEIMEALSEESQPKVSRNLAVLKKSQIITDRKNGQWVFYRINKDLPLWAKSVIATTTENNIPMIQTPLARLANMSDRPDKASFCK